MFFSWIWSGLQNIRTYLMKINYEKKISYFPCIGKRALNVDFDVFILIYSLKKFSGYVKLL